jgi:V-type H+-transporting ATPase subunit D
VCVLCWLVSSEHVIIPRTENTIKCKHTHPPIYTNSLLTLLDINSELDELDREEFYRLKKVAGKKQRDTAAADAEMKAKKEAQAKQETARPDDQDHGPADILATDEDDDVIF